MTSKPRRRRSAPRTCLPCWRRDSRRGNRSMRKSTEAHWTRFWRQRAAIDDVYPTEGRVVEPILAETSVRGKRVLEVGAGSGRDSVTLAEAGATAILLDYSMASLEVARGVARRTGQAVHL